MTTIQKIIQEFEEKWNSFYCYGWCDTDEDRKEWERMREQLKSFLLSSLHQVAEEVVKACKIEKRKPECNLFNSEMSASEDIEQWKVANNFYNNAISMSQTKGRKWIEENFDDYDKRSKNTTN